MQIHSCREGPLSPSGGRLSSELWGLEIIDAPFAWDHPNGSIGDPGVVVTIIDSGIDYTHEDLVANMLQMENDCSDGIDIELTGTPLTGTPLTGTPP